MNTSSYHTSRSRFLFSINPNNPEPLFPLDIEEDEFTENCQDGSHADFAENLNDQLLQLAEGYADATPSVLLGDEFKTFSGSSEEVSKLRGDLTFTLSKDSTEGKSHTTQITNSSISSRQIRIKHEMSDKVGAVAYSVNSSKSNKKKNRKKKSNNQK